MQSALITNSDPRQTYFIAIGPLLNQLNQGHSVIVFFSRFEFASEPYQKIYGGHPVRET